MSSRPPASGGNHPAEPALTRRRVDLGTLKTNLEVPATPKIPVDRYDLRAEDRRIAALFSRPLPKQELRRMAMRVVRFSEATEIASGKRSGPRQGKTLRDALHAAEDRIKTLRKQLRKSLEHPTSEPKMPSTEEALRRVMENLERERREHPERFLDEAQFAALQESVTRAAQTSDRPAPSRAELAALVSEVKYKLRGQEIDDINAGRKVAKVKKQTAKRVREHRARKAGKQEAGES